MKRSYRQTQIITIVALVVVMLGVSVGFAAFSNVLTIGTTAAVKPDSSTFSVLFSSSGTTQSTSAVSGVGSGGATAGSASISGTTISGLKANFTAPGQSVTYTFYSHNVGSFVAYLRNVNFGSGKNCTPGNNTSTDMVNAACDDISISVTIGGSSYTESTEVTGHTLAIDAYETVVVKLTYSSNGDVADGDFSVTFGDVSLTYSSIDGEASIEPPSVQILTVDKTPTGEYLDNENSNATFNITIGKEDESETLNFVITSTLVAGDESQEVFEEPESKKCTYTNNSSSLSLTCAVASGFSNMEIGKMLLIKIDVLNSNNELLDTITLDDYTYTSPLNATSSTPYTYYISCLPAGTLITVEVEEEDENGNKKKKRKKKKIEDLTYDDDLVVWDFDNGCFTTTKPLWLQKKRETTSYNLLKFSDGTELKTVRQHRIFNKELGKFTYPMTDETPIGTTTFTDEGKETTLISKEVITESVDYYNVISYYHMNVFAEGILTSCRFSNLYEIKDMKYIKDDRELIPREEYSEIPDDYYYGLRLSEQPREVNRGNDDKNSNSIEEYIENCIKHQK